MDSDSAKELEAVRGKILIANLIGGLGAISLGLGISAMFAPNGKAFHPLLNDEITVRCLIVLGVVIDIWYFVKVIPLFKKLKELMGGS